MFKNLWDKTVVFFVEFITPIHWKQDVPLTEDDVKQLREQLTKNYYIIATRRDNFLTGFFISLGHFFLTGRWGYYSHVLFNLEDEVASDDDFRLIEAATIGTHYVTFEKMTSNCNAVALIKVKGVTLEEWTKMMDTAKSYLGRPYDTLFDITNDQQINCVELIRLALQSLPDYYTRFAHFEAYISKEKNLTPQMFLESPEFEVVWEVRR